MPGYVVSREYSNHATSEFSINRAHSEDCASVKKETREAKDKLERIAEHIGDLFNENLGKFNGMLGDSPAHRESEVLDEAFELVRGLADEITDCDCGGHNVSSCEYRYFNPSFNYVTKDDTPADGLTPEDVRKYVQQDYERMESLNDQSWCYLGIFAEAEVLTNAGSMSTVQRITSGGLWGVESDSDRAYLESVAQEELSGLKSELSAIGFSSRAISKAFQSIEKVQS